MNWIALEEDIPDEDCLLWVYGHNPFVGSMYDLAFFCIQEVDTEEYTGKFMSTTDSDTEFTWVTHWQFAHPPDS